MDCSVSARSCEVERDKNSTHVTCTQPLQQTLAVQLTYSQDLRSGSVDHISRDGVGHILVQPEQWEDLREKVIACNKSVSRTHMPLYKIKPSEHVSV